jgi:hypothetical protein
VPLQRRQVGLNAVRAAFTARRLIASPRAPSALGRAPTGTTSNQSSQGASPLLNLSYVHPVSVGGSAEGRIDLSMRRGTYMGRNFGVTGAALDGRGPATANSPRSPLPPFPHRHRRPRLHLPTASPSRCFSFHFLLRGPSSPELRRGRGGKGHLNHVGVVVAWLRPGEGSGES